jgi:hypothetical protein
VTAVASNYERDLEKENEQLRQCLNISNNNATEWQRRAEKAELDLEKEKERLRAEAKSRETHARRANERRQQSDADLAVAVRERDEWRSNCDSAEASASYWSECEISARKALANAEAEVVKQAEEIKAWRDASGLLVVGSESLIPTPRVLSLAVRHQSQRLQAAEVVVEAARGQNGTPSECWDRLTRALANYDAVTK